MGVAVQFNSIQFNSSRFTVGRVEVKVAEALKVTRPKTKSERSKIIIQLKMGTRNKRPNFFGRC